MMLTRDEDRNLLVAENTFEVYVSCNLKFVTLELFTFDKLIEDICRG